MDITDISIDDSMIEEVFKTSPKIKAAIEGRIVFLLENGSLDGDILNVFEYNDELNEAISKVATEFVVSKLKAVEKKPAKKKAAKKASR